jgi:hypothetical protein
MKQNSPSIFCCYSEYILGLHTWQVNFFKYGMDLYNSKFLKIRGETIYISFRTAIWQNKKKTISIISVNIIHTNTYRR